MFKSLITTAGAGMMALTMTAAPAPAQAHSYHHRYYHTASGRSYYYDRYHHRHYRNCKAAGTVVGVIGGAVVGNALTHHSGLGTIAGAGIGGLAGHDIAAHNCRH
jgi:hypothetical protein